MLKSDNGGGRPGELRGWGIAVSALLLPFMAMQLTSEVNWTGSDFLFAAILIGAVGLLFELAVRMSDSRSYRAGVGLALTASFLTIWATGAVGMIGDEGNPLNLMFAAVLLIALLGSALGGFRAGGMARAMAAAAVGPAFGQHDRHVHRPARWPLLGDFRWNLAGVRGDVPKGGRAARAGCLGRCDRGPFLPAGECLIGTA